MRTSRRRSCRRSYTIPALVDAIVKLLRSTQTAASNDVMTRTQTPTALTHDATAAAAAHARATMRALVRETRLSPDMFMLPLFVCEGEGVRREVPSMPGVFNLSVDEAVKEAAAAQGRRRQQRAAVRPARAARTTSGRWPTIRRRRCSRRSARSSARSPDVLVVTDVCLCEYTDHGHCGIVDRRRDRQRSDASISWCARPCRTPRPAPTSSRRRT